MRQRLVALAAVVLSACSQGPVMPTAHVSQSPVPASPGLEASPGPQASPSTTAQPSTTAPPITLPFTDLPLSAVSFSCRLPIYNYGQTIQDSFISFPSGGVTVDTSATGGMYFDRAYSRWLPVARAAVAPDGTAYAYIEISQDPGVFLIHTVSVNSPGTTRDVVVSENAGANGFGAQPQVFDYAADGIYITQAFEHMWAGVWLFQQPSGPIRKVADVVPEVSAGGGIIWFGGINPADPAPLNTASSAGILPDEVSRLDLKTGMQAQWLYRPGAGLQVLGVDKSGHPLIRALAGVANPAPHTDPIDHSVDELLIALDPTTQRSIYKGQLVETFSGPIADSHGVWFGSPQGIYLYSATQGLQKVSNQPGYPANGCF